MDVQKINGSIGAWMVEQSGARKAAVPAKPASRDRVELSSDGVRTRNGGHGVSKLASASPEIREEKVQEAREKVETGYYDKPETIDNVANRMVDNGFTK